MLLLLLLGHCMCHAVTHSHSHVHTAPPTGADTHLHHHPPFTASPCLHQAPAVPVVSPPPPLCCRCHCSSLNPLRSLISILLAIAAATWPTLPVIAVSTPPPLVVEAQWRREHAAVRAALERLGQERPSLAPPRLACSEIEGADAAAEGLADWSQFRPQREADLLTLIEAVCKMWQVDLHGYQLHLFDVTEQTSHGRYFACNQLPPFLTGHRVVFFPTGRHLLGLEHLFMLGFPHDICTGGITDRHLRHLAGNTIDLHQLCPLLSLILSFVDLSNPAEDFPNTQYGHPPLLHGFIYASKPHKDTSFAHQHRIKLPGLETRRYPDSIKKLTTLEMPKPQSSMAIAPEQNQHLVGFVPCSTLPFSLDRPVPPPAATACKYSDGHCHGRM